MKKEYNFKEGIRGQFYRPKKVQKTLRLDPDVLGYYMKLSHQEGIPYQTLINLTLRKFAVEGGSVEYYGWTAERVQKTVVGNYRLLSDAGNEESDL